IQATDGNALVESEGDNYEIVVIGGTGLIGSKLVKELREHKCTASSCNGMVLDGFGGAKC
ncbi:MAG TPA: hypothetical protein VF783_18105, partial [Terriglobales bacterium]